MTQLRKLAWGISHPLAALADMTERIRYPWYKRHVGLACLYDTLGRHQFELLLSFALRPEHSLLDIGCGSLRVGKFFIPYLRPGNYFRTEPNRRAVAEGVGHNLDAAILIERRPTFSHDSDFRLAVFGRKFDFLLAHSIFTHASQNQIRACFQQARMVMSAQSLFFANYNRGKADYSGNEWVYHGHVTYTFGCISAFVNETDLQCHELSADHLSRVTWIVACDSVRPVSPPIASISGTLLVLAFPIDLLSRYDPHSAQIINRPSCLAVDSRSQARRRVWMHAQVR
jgi:SAM-dependent methyltransferase